MDKKQNVFKENILIIMIVFVIWGMWLYGYALKSYGYSIPGDNDNETLVALGFLELSYGVMPWNMERVENEVIHDSDNVAQYEYSGAYAATDELPLGGIASDGTYLLYDSELLASVSNNQAREADMPYIGQVDEEYFDDALFIGDSRMEGVYEYAGLNNATFYAKISMSVYNLLETKLTSTREVANVREGLMNNQFGKIYIMVGINELGTADTEYFMRHYTEVVATIKELQPDAIIILQGIMHVTSRMSKSDAIFNNRNINERNEAISQLANGIDIFYIDVNPVYDDANGSLRSDYSSDNVHLLGNKYGEWRDFYYSHGVIIPDDKDDVIYGN